MMSAATINRLTRLLMAVACLAASPYALHARDNMDRSGPMFFVGLTGQGDAGKNKVLLRWYSTGGELPFTKFSVYRKSGQPHDPGSYAKISETAKLRNIPLIRSIFERAGEDAILKDIIDVLSAMNDVPVTKETYATRLVQLLDGELTCDACGARASLLAQSNYGVALVEGLGYLDRVTPGVYSYELRTSTGVQTDNLVIGRITIDASTITELPAPTTPTEVVIDGVRGDRKVFLTWEPSADLSANAPISFGYNVYRYDGAISAGDTFELLEGAGMLTKINRLPIMLNNQQSPDRPESEQYDFMDDNLSFDRIGRLGDKFVVGDDYTYWIAARDLLGQRGEPSNPIIVTIEDRLAPPIPRGLKTVENRIGPDRRINLVWDSNADGDTVGYAVHRFRWYHHVGRPGNTFADDAELDYGSITEGEIDRVAEPPRPLVTYRDTDINLSDHEGMAFWYCVSAIDAAGNQSPLSAPVRGVLYDRDAPTPPTTIQICTTRLECDVRFSKKGSEPQPGQNLAVFHIERTNRRVTTAKVVVFNQYNEKDPYRLLYYGPFKEGDAITVSDDYDLKSGGVYQFSFKTKLGDWCGPYELPEDILNEIQQTPDTKTDILVTVGLHPKQICRDATLPGRAPHDPTADASTTPVVVNVTLSDDAVGAHLYRAEDCTDFHRIDTEFANGGSTVSLLDSIRPGSTSVICYGIRTFDGDGNSGAMTYLETRVVFSGNESVIPKIDAVTASGSETSPEAVVRWFGPNEGISGYRVHFATGASTRVGALGELGAQIIGSSTGVSSIYSTGDLSYSSTTGFWSVRLNSLDNLGAYPLETNTQYRVWVTGIDPLGETIEGENTVRFTWTSEETPEEELEWPVRPLPPHEEGVTAFEDQKQGGVLLLLTDPAAANQEVNPLDVMLVNTPFMVYRKRTDIPDRSYVQISPLIEKINTDSTGKTINDPFIYATNNAAYYVDNVGIVKNAKYLYIVVELDALGELSLVRGPTSEVAVTFD